LRHRPRRSRVGGGARSTGAGPSSAAHGSGSTASSPTRTRSTEQPSPRAIDSTSHAMTPASASGDAWVVRNLPPTFLHPRRLVGDTLVDPPRVPLEVRGHPGGRDQPEFLVGAGIDAQGVARASPDLRVPEDPGDRVVLLDQEVQLLVGEGAPGLAGD